MSIDRLTHGSLPHWYRPGYAHFVTYRLAGTIPLARLQDWKWRRTSLLEKGPPSGVERWAYRERIQKQFFAEYDRFLDAGTERNWLTDPRIAGTIRENLLHHHGTKYELLAWCVMSNHVHLVIQPFETRRIVGGAASLPIDAGSVDYVEAISDEVADSDSPLSSIMHSLKSDTANRINALLGRTGTLWQRESYDHWIRDTDELDRIVAYVIHNPVSAGLCAEPHHWLFGSACDRFQRDGSRCGFVGRLRDDWLRAPGP